MDAQPEENSALEAEIQHLMQEAKRIQDNPMAFLQSRENLLGYWLGQSLKN